MTQANERNHMAQLLEMVGKDGTDSLLGAFRLLLNEAMRLERDHALERTNREVKRRTRVASLFPNEASCLRLVTAVLREIHEEWVVGRLYLAAPRKPTAVKPDQNFYRKRVA